MDPNRSNSTISVCINITHLSTNQSRIKPWHKNVESDLRNQLIKKFFTAIFPNHSSTLIQEEKLLRIVNFTKGLENKAFEEADSLDHYYYKLADKIFEINKELSR